MNQQTELSGVAVLVRDWSHYGVQLDTDHDFDCLNGWIVGVLLRQDEDKLVIAHQLFMKESQVRHVTVIPVACVVELHAFDLPKTMVSP